MSAANAPPPASLKPALATLCASYLLHGKRGLEPLDPVARFHLGNGARLVRINWQGDTSPRGLTRSFGLMVNYVYELAAIERNHEAFATHGAIACSASIATLAKPLTSLK
jgi:malonyl-CoA decarboxylase